MLQLQFLINHEKYTSDFYRIFYHQVDHYESFIRSICNFKIHYKLFDLLFIFPTRSCCPSCKGYYRLVLTFVPGGVALVAFVALLTLIPYKIGQRTNTGKGANSNDILRFSQVMILVPVFVYLMIPIIMYNMCIHFTGK